LHKLPEIALSSAS